MSNLTFYFDPVCPWAWRTFLWVREVHSLQATYKIFSLKEINRDDSLGRTSDDAFIEPAELALVLARRRGGNAAMETLYLALGRARHERRGNLATPSVIEAALEEAGMNRALLGEALDDRSVYEEAAAEHREAVERYEAFGVPWLVLDGQRHGLYGPVISEVPRGEAAIELWNHVEWLHHQPYFWEIKRSRP